MKVSPFSIDVAPVSNEAFREFVRATKYKTEAESFGWSFAFHEFVSDSVKAGVRPSEVTLIAADHAGHRGRGVVAASPWRVLAHAIRTKSEYRRLGQDA
jgi:formylglycine-generating enzyme required for sulfatase activity